MLLLREVELFVVVVVVGPSDVSCFRFEFVLFQLLLLRVPCRAIAGRKKGKKKKTYTFPFLWSLSLAGGAGDCCHARPFPPLSLASSVSLTTKTLYPKQLFLQSRVGFLSSAFRFFVFNGISFPSSRSQPSLSF